MKKNIRIIIVLILITLILIMYMLFSNDYKHLISQKGYNDNIEANEKKISKEQEEYYKKLNEQTFDKVSIRIKENTLSKTGATFIITDENEIFYSFGQDYKLEKNILGNIWIEMPLKSGYTIDGSYGHGANGITEMKIDWSERYGELKKRKI